VDRGGRRREGLPVTDHRKKLLEQDFFSYKGRYLNSGCDLPVTGESQSGLFAIAGCFLFFFYEFHRKEIKASR
jgi:hypothetical protein